MQRFLCHFYFAHYLYLVIYSVFASCVFLPTRFCLAMRCQSCGRDQSIRSAHPSSHPGTFSSHLRNKLLCNSSNLRGPPAAAVAATIAAVSKAGFIWYLLN